MAPPSDFLTIEQVVELFPGQTKDAIYAGRYRGQGLGALAIRVGKRLIWRRSDIDAWFDRQLAEQQEARRA